MKICKKCSIEKDLDSFYIDKYSKCGYRNSCKECDKKYREENKDKLRVNQKSWENNNKERRKEYFIKYREENKDEIKEKSQKYYEDNKEILLKNHHTYRNNNKVEINKRERERYLNIDVNIKKEKSKKKNEENKEYRKEYYESNKENILENRKRYYIENKEKRIEYSKLYNASIGNDKRSERDKIKRKEDPIYYLNECIRSSIKRLFKSKGFYKKSRTHEILGCSIIEFKLYIESKFEFWMTWENKGLYNGEFNYGWDLDHIIPASSALTEDDLVKLNHYTNLQPLCSKINRDIKKGKLNYPKINPGER